MQIFFNNCVNDVDQVCHLINSYICNSIWSSDSTSQHDKFNRILLRIGNLKLLLLQDIVLT